MKSKARRSPSLPRLEVLSRPAEIGVLAFDGDRAVEARIARQPEQARPVEQPVAFGVAIANAG